MSKCDSQERLKETEIDKTNQEEKGQEHYIRNEKVGINQAIQK